MPRHWTIYRVNELFFDSWSPDSAYVIGWFLGDGHLERKYFDLAGSLYEAEHLRKIADCMGSNHPVINYNGHACHVRIGRISMVERLRELGMGEKRVPESCGGFEAHCVRGFFDSDGAVQWNKGRRNGRFKLVSTNIEALRSVGRGLLSKSIESHLCITSGEGVRKVSGSLVVSSPRFERMYQYLYGSSGLYLEGKKQTADQILAAMQL